MAEATWSKMLRKLCSVPVEEQAGDMLQQPIIPIHSSSDAKPKLYALIIGIDDYLYQDPLFGAVNDATAFKDYLTDDLSVPKDNITMVLNQDATRDGIIEAMQGLRKNDKIEHGDPIVIYYAGHGAEIEPPADRAVNGALVQCIIPRDADTQKEAKVCPIPDFTVGALLHQLYQDKGDNITVIFDCCHSAGGSRDQKKGARFIAKDKLAPLPANVDSHIIGAGSTSSRETAVVPGFSGQAMNSHVLMAGCGHAEKSYESDATGKHAGAFTTALLELLRRTKIDNLTYKGCMQRFPALNGGGPQHPVCEGANINRIFFNAKVPGADNSFILVKSEEPNGNEGKVATDTKTRKLYYLQAGLAQGITPGSTFAIHDEAVIGPKNPPRGTLVVHTIEPFRVLLRLPDGAEPFPISEPAYGRQIGYGSEQALDVYMTDDFLNAAKPSDAWTRAFSGGQGNVVLRPADQPVAHLTVGLSADKEHATFTLAAQYDIQTLPQLVPAEAGFVVSVLRAAARWSWHLRRTPGDHPFQSALDLEFFKLKPSGTDKQGLTVWVPDGHNLNVGGVADIQVQNKEERYGLKITNKSRRNLYAYPFYFSVTNQSILQEYTKVCGSGRIDPSLPRDEKPYNKTEPKSNFVTVGYGSGGVDTLRHYLKPDQDIDVGIYKIFITTEPTDFDSIAQDSPFEQLSRDVAKDDDVHDSLYKKPLWDTISLTVVQRRYPKKSAEPHEPVGTLKQASGGEPAPLLVQETNQNVLIPGKPREVTRSTPSWFRTENLTAEILSKATGLNLRTCSRVTDGKVSDGNGAWFEVCIIGPDGATKYRPDDDEEPLQWRSHGCKQADDNGASDRWATGSPLERGKHELWDMIKEGDAIAVNVCARGKDWINEATKGVLTIW